MRKNNQITLTVISLATGLFMAALGNQPWLFANSKRTARPAFERVSREGYPYTSSRFATLVSDSYDETKLGATHDFFSWMEDAYRRSNHFFAGKEHLTLREVLVSKREGLSRIKNPREKSRIEIGLAKWLHKLVKSTIPKFSLDRGFEFAYVVKNGERQCLLQSVLIAAMMQEMGMDAGLAMVYKNIAGEEVNNAHAVTLLKLPNGRDIIVDASEPEPFANQQGLFVRLSGYRYVDPVYEKGGNAILYYRLASGGKMRTRRVRPLDYNFVRSQFYYYRGERVPGALMASERTKEGLASSAAYLEKSITFCPLNPLAVYMLGRVRMAQGDTQQARSLLERAYCQYQAFGWVPAGPKEYLHIARQQARGM